MEYFSLILHTLSEPISFAVMLESVVLGVVFGAVSGPTSNMATTLLLPVTFKMAARLGITILMSTYVGGMLGGFIAATLVGTPDTPSSITACFDVYPLSQKEQITKALGAGVLGSFLGTSLSTTTAVFFRPLIAKATVNLGLWKYSGLHTMAITLVISLSKGNTFKGLAVALIGLLPSAVRYTSFDAAARLTLRIDGISGSINMAALMLGTFVVYQVILNCTTGQRNLPTIEKANIRGIGVTLRELRDNVVNIVRLFLTGLWIGFLPGMGVNTPNMVAYSQTRGASKHPKKSGTGCVDGVFASEVSNNAVIGGAIIPLIAPGIPRDTVTAVMLNELMIHGVELGPPLMTKEPKLVYVIFGAMLLAAILTPILQLLGTRPFPRLLTIPYHYLFGTIGIICFVDAFSDTNTLFNCGLILACALFALLTQMGGLLTGPMMLVFILGNELETNLHHSMMVVRGNPFVFFTRPASCVFLLIVLVSVLVPLISMVREDGKKENQRRVTNVISKQITYNMDRENFSPVSAEGMKAIYGDRTSSFRAALIPNIVHVARSRPLHLQLIKLISHEPGRRYPLVVYVQGSGFGKREYSEPISQLAQLVHEGYVVASVEHHYSDEGGVFPAQAQDLKAAVRYLRTRAGEYQIDPDRIALWGDSSNGHTAAPVALSDGAEKFDTPGYKEQHPNAKCCVDFYGMLEFESICEIMTSELIQHFGEDLTEKLFGDPISEHQEGVKRANLASYITRDEVIPPPLPVHGDEDVKVHLTQSIKFYNLLKDNERSVGFYKAEGGGHGNRTWTLEVMGLVKELLRAYL